MIYNYWCTILLKELRETAPWAEGEFAIEIRAPVLQNFAPLTQYTTMSYQGCQGNISSHSTVISLSHLIIKCFVPTSTLLGQLKLGQLAFPEKPSPEDHHCAWFTTYVKRSHTKLALSSLEDVRFAHRCRRLVLGQHMIHADNTQAMPLVERTDWLRST